MTTSFFGHGKPRGLGLLALVVLLAGCNDSQPTDAPSTKTPTAPTAPAAAPQTAEDWLQAMAETYRQANTYSDAGQLRLRLVRGEESTDDSADFSVTFSRPNRLRMHVYQAIVVSDGEKLYGTIGDLEGQVVTGAAPEALTLEAIMLDQILMSVMTEGIAGAPPQLALLLTDDALDTVTAEAKEIKLLGSDGLDGHVCQRVAIVRPDGQLVFWIDEQTYAVRRIEFPTDTLREAIDGVEELALWAELSGAQLNEPIEDVAFKFEVPEGAKLVERFDTRSLMPKPPEPSKLLGQEIPEFTFMALDGSEVTRESLAGKVAVIDFWATWCGPCMESLPNLNQVYARFKDRDDVEFLAVSIDVSDVADEQLKETFAKQDWQMTIVRDTNAVARDVFGVEGIPNLFVLGPDGKVQDNEVGINPRLAAEMPAKIEKLLAGESIYEATLRDYELRLEEYEQAVDQPLDESSANGAPRQVKIAEKSDPATLELTELWQAADIAEPGNLLAVERDGQLERLIVNDGWKKIVELAADGSSLGQHEPAIPDSAVISFVRTAVEPDGRRLYAGAATTQPQAFLFDEGWNLVATHPAEEGREVADVQLGDLNGDGQTEVVVSYWGNAGVDCLSSTGELLWNRAELENPFRMALSGTDDAGQRTILCANTRGTLLPIDPNGELQNEIAVGRRFIRYLVARDLDDDGQPELCGIAATMSGSEALVGFAADGTELWSYPLPAGMHQQPIEMISTGRLNGQGHWIVAAADGSIHLVGHDGTAFDRFNYGETLTGIAASGSGDTATLYVSTPDGLKAWKVTPRAGASL